MFERFTDRARRVVVLAQEEARLQTHNYIGTEHLLLGIIHEREGVAALALESLGVSLDTARAEVLQIVGPHAEAPVGHIPFTRRAKKVLELSLREALQLGHNYIGTEHILLGIVREGDGVGAQVLTKLGVDLPTVRQRVVMLLAGQPGAVPTSGSVSLEVPAAFGVVRSPAPRFGPPGRHCSFCGRDLWEADHYVTSETATICDRCITVANDALATATPGSAPILQLPTRVFGAVPDDAPDAVEQIADALDAVFAHARSPESAGFLEDGDQLAPVLLESRTGFPNMTVTSVALDRLRFWPAEPVAVAFRLVLDTGATYPFEGTMVRAGGRWLVSRATLATVLGSVGITLPPPEH